MTAEWDDLARLAQAATPGPWDWRDEQYPGQLVHRMEVGGWPVHPQNVLKCKDDWLPTSADAKFIAAANPATILRLIEERRALAARLAAVEALADEWQRELDEYRIRDENARYCWAAAAREVRAALAAPTDTTKET